MTQKDIFRKVLTQHQLDYNLLSIKQGPTSFCKCGHKSPIKLKGRPYSWSTAMIEEAEFEVHLAHQAEVFQEELENEGFTT